MIHGTLLENYGEVWKTRTGGVKIKAQREGRYFVGGVKLIDSVMKPEDKKIWPSKKTKQ